MEQNQIYIVMSVDRGFLNHLLVVIRSAKYFSSRLIHLFLCVRDEKTRDFFKSTLDSEKSPSFSFDVIVFDSDILLNIFDGKTFDHPIECYFRIMLPSIIPAFVKKIIYLDADMIVFDDLAQLYDIHLDTIIGGVIDRFGHNYCKKYILEDLGVKLDVYINAGLLIIDLEKWRKQNNETDMLLFLEKNFYKLKMLDQDLINIYFQSQITLIDPKWNHFLFHGEYDKKIKDKGSIYHLIGSRKGNSIVYPNYTIKKIYNFFSGKRPNFLEDLSDIFIFIFFSLPLSKFLIQKSILHYRGEKFKMPQGLFIFLIFYPPVFIVFCGELFFQFRKRGLKGLFQRLLEFLN